MYALSYSNALLLKTYLIATRPFLLVRGSVRMFRKSKIFKMNNKLRSREWLTSTTFFTRKEDHQIVRQTRVH